MDFDERVIPGVSANFLYKEAISRYQFAKKRLSNGVKLLDAGCGTGYGSYLLTEKAQVIGIDIDPEAIEYAQKHFGAKVIFEVSKIEKTEFSNSTFDAICSFEVIEHLKDTSEYIKEISRVMKKEGTLFISTPNKLVMPIEKDVNSPYHFKEYMLSEMEIILKKSFKKIDIYGQYKSKRAQMAIKQFMKSQTVRQSFVDTDVFGLRKLIPRKFKEWIWVYLGAFFGRKKQEDLSWRDFPITRITEKQPDYLILICQK